MKATTLPTITLNVRVFAASWASAQDVQDIADDLGAVLVRSFTEGNGDMIYKASGCGIANFRTRLQAKGFHTSIA